ncbi:MAG: cysteine desulfurase [Oligoflexia bacterium]|nr:cysteine desulfurase [Oligoflexia bacterium]
MVSKVYLDFNATTPPHHEVVLEATKTLTSFGNPSSVHWAGREAKKLIQEASEVVAKFIQADPRELIFTSGGSESNNLAIKGALEGLSPLRNEIIISSVEHPSVTKTAEYLQSKGYKLHRIKVNRQGVLDIEHYKSLLSPRTALVSCMLVNNETGNIFPIPEMVKMAHESGALFHSDMVQGLGKLPIQLREWNVDLASFSAHKFYGLKGSGVLFAKSSLRIKPIIHGGGQQRGRRAGTENVLAINSLATAVKKLGPVLTEQNARVSKLRDLIESQIRLIPGVTINGAEGLRVSNTVNATFPDVEGETLLINLDLRGFAVSSGAACSSGTQEPSPVLTAMGLSLDEASRSLRISLGWTTTEEEVDRFLRALHESLTQVWAARREYQERENSWALSAL